MRKLITVTLLAALSACGLTSTALDTKRTPVDGTTENFDKIEAALKGLGWQYKRSPSDWDWTFEIWPMKGERIRVTSHAQTNEISFCATATSSTTKTAASPR